MPTIPRLASETLDRIQRDDRRLNIFGPVLLLSLFGSVTNYVPLSIVASTLAFAVWPFGMTLGWRVPKPVVAVAMLFGFLLIYIVLYNPGTMIEVQFYRRDGNVFVTMAPLIFFGCLAIPFDLEYILKRFVYFATAINGIIFLVWVLTGTALFRAMFTEAPAESNLYFFLFVAHNAAGGFLAMLCCFSLALFVHNRNAFHLAIVLLNCAALASTFSRGSIGGFIGAALLVYVLTFSKRWPMWVFSFMLAVNLALVAYIYSYTDINTILSRQMLVTRVIGDLSPSLQPILDGNLTIRIETLWPMAFHAFLQSPLLGIGFSGFNDVPWDIWGLPGLIAFNGADISLSTDATAHNTYMQMLAETGIVGMALLFMVIKRMLEYVIDREPGMITDGLMLAVWAAVIAAFSEHRFFTPSQMLPLVLMYAMMLARDNYAQKLEQFRETIRVKQAKEALLNT